MRPNRQRWIRVWRRVHKHRKALIVYIVVLAVTFNGINFFSKPAGLLRLTLPDLKLSVFLDDHPVSESALKSGMALRSGKHGWSSIPAMTTIRRSCSSPPVQASSTRWPST